MPKVKIGHRHRLPLEEVKRRLNNILDPLIEEFGKYIRDPVQYWKDDTAHFSYGLLGSTVKGTITVDNFSVEICTNFPIVALPFKKIALKITAKRLEALLDEENRYHDAVEPLNLD